MLSNAPAEIQKFIVERVLITTSQIVPECKLLLSRGTVDTIYDDSIRGLIVTLDTYIHGLSAETIVVHRKWPKNWWDAFKERWFPAWALRRWPVVYERLDIEENRYKAVCPHLQCDNQQTHLSWLGRIATDWEPPSE